eukprot:CAMPEP_0202027792 /NCGR_PEP_ID=MMETSP0905-20130828/62385_1 /ASSEMBLY_ACC=CAM_ASM_000554 /TAXON_ID=420261 /ORGANISM="Thalassiosira antarctica, Strain CCMP982" /LENGTH=63 /DNA_ID=CAMNT_0048591397 /DNA_START=34 /DNA_END=229 /DNA_ORIENTATION=+
MTTNTTTDAASPHAAADATANCFFQAGLCERRRPALAKKFHLRDGVPGVLSPPSRHDSAQLGA